MKLTQFFSLVSILGGIVAPISAQISDPIPGSIAKGDLLMEIENYVRAPATGGSPRTRIAVTKAAFDGSGRLFSCDLRGQFYVIANDAITTYVDFNDVFPNFEPENRLGTGLHSFAFHPDFETNGKFYTAHSENAGSGTADFTQPISDPETIQSVVVEWTATDPSANTFAGTRREIMRISYNEQVHNIQEIAFNHFITSSNADYGMLYICSGDGEAVNQGYPEIAHRLDTVYGTLLRIDPMGSNAANGKYGIPADNPFVSDGDASTLGEIYAWGFRNPHRIIWDPENPERLFLFDIGERNLEEVNLIVKGGDHGYSVREGTFLMNTAVDSDVVFPLPADDASNGYIYPVAQYDHDEGRAIAGGQIYRGDKWPELNGKMLFGDIANGRIFYVDADSLTLGSQATFQELRLKNVVERSLLSIVGQSRTDLRFGMGEDGEIFITTKRDGWIRRFTPPPEPLENGSGEISNLSTRGTVGGSDSVMIGGFVIIEDNRRVLVRGLGPTLANFGVNGALEDPKITIYNAAEEIVATNDNWGDEFNATSVALTATSLGATALEAGSADAAKMLYLPKGSYTVHLEGVGGSSGVGLIEIYKIP
ncbi:PQQ-dependent sugar dehydrogenase [Opitutaceae bacterium]|nr:PQQ-dependent sugar dehydrogenase [Opitutaceae bacterium]